MPLPADHVDGAGTLDDDLLAALDDVLAFSEPTFNDEAFSVIDPMALGDEFGAMLPVEISPLQRAGESTEMPMSPSTPDDPAKAFDRPTSSHRKPSFPSKTGKDTRVTPYSAADKLHRRKRPKDELDYLRAKVADMEEELDALKRQEVESQSSKKDKASMNVGSSQIMLQCWKKLAERERTEADLSVLENLRLRAMLEGQLNVVRSLEAAIDQQQRQSAQSFTLAGVGVEGSNLSDESLFAHLNGSLDSQYMELNTIFELSGIARINWDMKNGTKVLRDETGMSIRHEEVCVMPFSTEAVHRVIWGIFRYRTIKDMILGPIRTQVLSENRINVIMMEKTVLGTSRVTNIVRRFSFQRVFEEDRTVIIWSSYIEIEGIYVRLRARGYLTISAYNFGTDSFGDGVPGSVTRIVVLAKPELTALALTELQGPQIGEMTESIVDMYRVSLGLIRQVFDTLLLREAMGGHLIKHASPVPTSTN